MAEFENFGFYTIDADYLEYLNNKNSEVYYNASYRVSAKYCYATHELRLHQNDRCKRFTLV